LQPFRAYFAFYSLDSEYSAAIVGLRRVPGSES
jgi:hypothetical protein